ARAWIPLGAEVDVQFTTRGGAAYVRVQRRAAKAQPEAWWVHYTKCTTELRIDVLQPMLPEEVNAVAAAMPLPRGTRFPGTGLSIRDVARIGRRSPYVGRVDARVDPRADIPIAIIGQAWIRERAAPHLPASRPCPAATPL